MQSKTNSICGFIDQFNSFLTGEEILLIVLNTYIQDLLKSCMLTVFSWQSASSCVVELLPVRAQCEPTGDEQHPEPRHHASLRHLCRGGRWDSHTQITVHYLHLSCSSYNSHSGYLRILDGMVSNFRRIRLRSNSTGTRPSFRRGASRRIAHQLETPEKPRSSAGKVPKSASVSGLSLIITPGRSLLMRL